MIKIKKINNEKIKPIKNIQTLEPKKIKGHCMFPSLYSNIFILAKKNSGKTTTIYNILKKGVNKKTIVYFFVSTIYKDQSYKEILDMLDKKNVKHFEYTNISEGKENNLEQIINELQTPEIEEQKEEKPKIKYIYCGDSSDEEEPEYKPKKISPEYFFIFDDISSELRNPIISTLIKKNRHFKAKVICSSQALHDMTPSSIQNLDYMLIFPNVPKEKLEVVHKQLDLAIDLKIFLEIYKNATSEKYNFLYIDTRNDTYRRNFNMQYELE